MQISARFTMAVHMFACVDAFPGRKMTSEFMAASIGTNPVTVRRLLRQLRAAGLLEVSRGTGGVTITRPLTEITFLDVYRAVECAPEEELFRFHGNPNPDCRVGRSIHAALDGKLRKVQEAMGRELASIRISEVTETVRAIGEGERREKNLPETGGA